MTQPDPHPSIQQAIDGFWDCLPPAWSQVRENLHRIATEKFGISVEQFHILRHIHKGVKSVSDLADVKHISRPAISQAVDLLVEKGYITRTQNSQDRRFVELSLTGSGRQLIDTIFQINGIWMAEKLAGLAPGELAQLTRGLEILHKAFNPSVE